VFRKYFNKKDKSVEKPKQLSMSLFVDRLKVAKLSVIGGVYALSLIDIAFMVLRHYCICLVVGIDMSFITLACITCISFFTGLISMMPMGLVGYDATFIFLMQQFNIPLEQALLVPLINRSMVILCACFLGANSAFNLGYNPFKEIKKMKKRIL
jgi:uncharacterized protein (TIRG00374 family)